METLREIISTSFAVYTGALFLVILASWVPAALQKPWLAAFYNVLKTITDPLLNVFRKVIPPLPLGSMQLDLSPILAFFALSLASRLLLWLLS